MWSCTNFAIPSAIMIDPILWWRLPWICKQYGQGVSLMVVSRLRPLEVNGTAKLYCRIRSWNYWEMTSLQSRRCLKEGGGSCNSGRHTTPYFYSLNEQHKEEIGIDLADFEVCSSIHIFAPHLWHLHVHGPKLWCLVACTSWSTNDCYPIGLTMINTKMFASVTWLSIDGAPHQWNIFNGVAI